MNDSENISIRVSAIWKNQEKYPTTISCDGMCLFADALIYTPLSSPTETEEAVFSSLREAAEQHPFSRITLCVKIHLTPTNEERTERTKAIIRGMFRAAVYGDISFMCEDIHTDKEYEALCSIFNSIFCEFEEEKREFNGYIRKGLLVDTPISVLSSSFKGADFICIDLDKMIPSLLGSTSGKSRFQKLYTRVTLDSLCSALVELFSEIKPPIHLMTSDFASNSFIFPLARALCAEELLIPISVANELPLIYKTKDPRT